MAHIVMNPAAIARLAADPAVGVQVTRAAEATAVKAAELAPVHTGADRRSFHAKPATIEAGIQRAYAYSDDAFAHLIEFGSANNPPYRPLTRAAQEVCGNFQDDR